MLSRQVLKRAFGQSSNMNLKGAMLKMFNYDNTEDINFQRATHPPSKPLREIETNETVFAQEQVNVTKLSNGIKVVSLSLSQPSVVDLGILMDVGTRDETIETSGTMLALKNTFLKTALNTNETVNYGMVQMSGGDFSMDYDQESSYYKAHCLQHDVVDIVSMMVDCALEPKTAVSADLAQYKNAESIAHEKRVNSGLSFNNSLFQLAYGLKGLGLPLMGLENHKNLTASSIQRFQLENIKPENMIICGAGIRNHNELVELVQYKLDNLGLLSVQNKETKIREKSVYMGGEQRMLVNNNTANMVLAFQTGGWQQQNEVFVNKVLQQIVGDSCNSSRNSRALNSIVLKQNLADKVQALNFNFSDSGLFGVQCQGPADKTQKLLDSVVSELKSIVNSLSQQELDRAKTVLINDVLCVLEGQSERLEETVRNIKVFGSNQLNNYVASIQAVKLEDLKKSLAKIISSQPTFILHSNNINNVNSLDKIVNALKL